MKTIDELRAYYNLEILPTIQKETNNFFTPNNSFIIFVIVFFITAFFLVTDHVALSLISFFLTGVVFFLAPKSTDPDVMSRYQQLVARPLLNAIDPTMKYLPSRGVSYSKIQHALLVDGAPYVKYTSNNFVTYKSEGLPVSLAHVSAWKTDQKGEAYPAVHGLFGETGMNRKIEGSTLVSIDFAEKHLGFIGKGLQSDSKYSRLKKVYLDNPAFEKKFLVYSNDPIEANYVLSFTVMEKLVQLSEKYNVNPTISFVGNKMNILLQPMGFFEANDYSFELAEHSIKYLYFVMEAIKAIHQHHEL